jgi:hypothetical protein
VKWKLFDFYLKVLCECLIDLMQKGEQLKSCSVGFRLL